MIPTLSTGGAERVISFISQNLDSKLFQSQLLVIDKKENSTFNIEKIPVTYLNKTRVLHAAPQIIHFLYKQKPDIVFSSIGHLNTLIGILSPLFKNIKFVIREASVVSVMQKFSAKKSIGKNFLSKWAFSNVDKVVCQSIDMANDFKNLYDLNDTNIVIIGNPITSGQPASIKKKKTPSNTKKFITVGRLSKEKGHHRVLNVLARLEREFSYLIIGDGPERANLIEQMDRLGLSDKITHIPYTDNVNYYLSENDLYLQGSYVEGFPNAVLESCAAGTPVLAFAAPGGTNEILEHNINGFIVENEEAFLKCLCSDKEWNHEFIQNSVYSKFSAQIILEKYQNLFTSLC
ncbi:glycosyltransferase [Zobellia galactanivorans]|nr:glycosyltransferase [Zobellia galactanivorans]